VPRPHPPTPPRQDPPYDSGSFAEGVTYDATPEAGAPRSCAPRVRKAWRALERLGGTEEGRTQLRRALRLCECAGGAGPRKGCPWTSNLERPAPPALAPPLTPDSSPPPRPRCHPSSVALDNTEDVEELRDWLASAFDYMAMGK
jgi:hypothetical protein